MIHILWASASATESRTNEVVWAAVIGGRAETLVVLHSNTPGYERNLAFLSQWSTRAQMLLAGQATPQSPLEQHFFDWVRHEWTPGACAHVLQRGQVGFSLFLQGFETNRAMMQSVNPHDINAMLVQLDCRHSNTKLLGFLPAPSVALQRLADLHQAGGKPVAAAVCKRDRFCWRTAATVAPQWLSFRSIRESTPRPCKRLPTCSLKANGAN